MLRSIPHLGRGKSLLGNNRRRNICYAVSTASFFYLDLNSSYTVSDFQKVHAQVIKSQLYSQGFVGDRLVSAYANGGRILDAERLFDEIPCKDLVSWNSLISAFARKGKFRESLNVLQCMMDADLRPNSVTMMSVVSSCAKLYAFHDGICLHGYVEKAGFLSSLEVVNALITMYGKFGCISLTHKLFSEVEGKNLVTWNSIIAIHSQKKFVDGTVDLFNLMRQSAIKPDRATILCVLQACANVAAEGRGRAIHGYVVSCGFCSDVPIVTALVHFYARSGNMDSSWEIFGEMNDPDIVAWTTVIGAYAMHGQGRRALEIFECMVGQGVRPDHVTFTHALNACSHSGLVEEGKKYFKMMVDRYRIQASVDHYSCMVDLLGRSGRLEEAHALIECMPFAPNAAIWGALLGACRVHRNIKLGKEAAERLFGLNPSDSRNFIILSNMYAREGLWDESSEVRAQMKERGLRKTPGCSFIEHNNKVVRFVVGDKSHPESEHIYAKLDELIMKMRASGYVPETDFVLHDVDDKLKEGMINMHSEKLAIAFGLLTRADGFPIVITKNLRICGDCHTVAKLISAIENHTLIIRDSKRFHHFSEGKCSCNDFW